MKHFTLIGFFALLGLLWSAHVAAKPCNGIPTAGCCDGKTLKFCRSDGTLATVNCNALGSTCTWDFGHTDETDGHYSCFGSSTQEDPDGAVPRACPSPAGECIPDCTGKECGDDGCGGSCGTCPTGTCSEFTCVPTGYYCDDADNTDDAAWPPQTGCCDGPMYKKCDNTAGVRGYSCDEDGLDRRCGEAADGTAGCHPPADIATALPDCANGCQRDCAGKDCGPDGCGGSCGGCTGDEQCNAGTCEVPSCDPACGRGEVCTFDGCEWQACIATQTETSTLVKSGSVAVWGPNLSTYTSSSSSKPLDELPSMPQGAKQITMGGTHVAAVDNNGTVHEWGGETITGCGIQWTDLPADASPMHQVDSWRCGFIGVYGTGQVAVWGASDYGPEQTYADGINDAVAVAAGANFLVLREDGTVSMFTAPGAEADVQHFYVQYAGTTAGDALWDDANNRLVSYVEALPGIEGATAIAAFGRHYLVVNGDGTIVEWGEAWLGRQEPPSEIVKNTEQIVAGSGYSLALLESGGLRLWIDSPTNPRQAGLLENVPARHDFVAVAQGNDPAALAADGSVVMWDENGPIAMETDVGFVTDFAVGFDDEGTHLVSAVTQCTQACTPSCTADTCQMDGCGGICPNCGGCDPSVSSCPCVPQCDGRACGDDGCGGSCGTCADDEVCTSTTGQCACVPDCDGKTCGPNGCGGSCGSCEAPESCTAAGTCECIPDCDGKNCGPDGCGGSCGTCDDGTTCNNQGLCACVPECDGKACGDDGCGGSCGACEPGEHCTDAGQCACTPNCEVKICDQNGCTGYTKICGPDGCGGSCGECPDGETCTLDGQSCDCIPSCEGKECGGDGCGGACPGVPATCDAANETCVDGQCECQPSCTDWPDGITGCGSDGCGGSCGTCPSGTACSILPSSPTGEGICECAPNCAGRECGPDGCGGACGYSQSATGNLSGCQIGYGWAYQCNEAGQCQCIPDCTGKVCGDDGCGGSCGTCPEGYACTDDGDSGSSSQYVPGQCECVPDCEGRECGPDGCGGTCGSGCPAEEEVCDVQTGQCYVNPCGYFNTVPQANCCVPTENGANLVTCDAELKKVVVEACGANNWACGWVDSENAYACGGGFAADPSGTNPIECPSELCIPDCLGKECGPDGCGGTCGAGCTGQFIECVEGQCVNTCEPECEGMECGDDGCGGSCGSCPAGESCAGGQCCTPQCDGKVCGPDGCGGTCGSCDESEACNDSGQCEQRPCKGFTRPFGCCEPSNTAIYCDTETDTLQEIDCGDGGLFCGWSGEDNGYRCVLDSSYPKDPNGEAPYLCPEDTCVPNCWGKNCGPDGCGGTCGTCAEGEECSASQLCYTPPPPCTPNCEGRCGPDGCGGMCPSCEEGKTCLEWGWDWSGDRPRDLSGTCVEPCFGKAPEIGCCVSDDFEDRHLWTCENPELADGLKRERCPADQLCGWSSDEEKFTCGGTDTPPTDVEMYCPGVCGCERSDGTTRECGDDGCGNSCGTCGPDQRCSSTGYCVDCFPKCEGKHCGDDGCGGSCGTCQGEATCGSDGMCELPASCGSVSAAGSCNGDTVEYCTDYGIQQYACPAGHHCASGECVLGESGAAAHSCSSSDCGTQNAQWACQCDAGCAERGDCCDNYERTCGAATSRGTCGDATCRPNAGEDCLTCAADCGDCADIEATSSAAVAPYPRVLRNQSLPGQHASYEVVPIDDVRPGGAPWPRDGLLAYLPEPGVNAGSPQTIVYLDGARRPYTYQPKTSTDGEVLSVADGKQGSAFSFNGTDGFHDPGLCGERECGPDGAGGSCGSCGDGMECDEFRGNCYDPNNCIEDSLGNSTGNNCNFGSQPAECGSSGCGRACGGGDGTCPNDGYCSRSTAQCWDKSTLDELDRCGDQECGMTPWANLSCGTCSEGEACRADGYCYDDVSSGGLVRIVPRTPTPRDGSNARHVQGGATLAFWARVTPGSLEYVNPLAATRSFDNSPTFGSSGEACDWTRPGDAALDVSCPAGHIVAVEAYYGSVESAPWPDGTCDGLRRIRQTGTCSLPAAQVDAEACLGRAACSLDYRGIANPCAGESTDSLLSMRVVCDASHAATSTLYVGGANEGNHVRLRLPDGNELASTTAFEAGTWTHVALSHERRGNGLGDVTLWMNGVAEARAERVRFPDAYEWDIGAGHFPSAPDIPNAINDAATLRDSVTGEVLAFRAPTNVAGSADVDDIFLYDRALSPREITSLYTKPDAGALRVWPAIDPARSLVESTWSDADATTTPVEAAALLDPVKSTPSNPVPFATDEAGLHLPEGTSFVAADLGTDLDSLSTFTLAGWVRPSTLDAGTALLELTEGSTSELILSTSSACDGGALTASVGGEALAASTACVHGLAADDWAFVAYVQNGSEQSVYVDSVLTASGTAPTTLFTGSEGATRALRAGDGVDLSWAALFEKTFTPEELEALRSQGPAVWIEGSAPLDLAAFHNNASGSPTDTAALWSGDGPAVSGSDAEVTVPARGRFRSVEGGAERAFSWSGQVTLPPSLGTSAVTFPLFTLQGPDRQLVDADLRCSAADANGRVACDVRVGGIDDDGNFQRWASERRIAASTALAGANAHIAIAYSSAPSVAMYLESEGDAVALAVAGGVTLEVGEIGSAGDPPASSASSHQFVMPPSPRDDGARWSDLRLYARILSPTELGALVKRGCAAQNCEARSRTCVTPGSSTATLELSVCGGCADGTIEHAGRCLDKQPFHAVCADDVDCASDVCGPRARCLADAGAGICQDTCIARGRDCVQLEGTDFYTCSDRCHEKPDSPYALPGENFYAVDGKCEWRPTQAPGQVCTDDYDCTTAKCVGGSRTGYSVDNEIPYESSPYRYNDPNVCYATEAEGEAGKCAVPRDADLPVIPTCAGFDKLACKEKNRVAVPKSTVVPGLGSTTVFSCGGCAEGYREQWTLLSPEGCETMWKNYYKLGDYKNENYQGYRELMQEPNLTVLRRLLLADPDPTSNPTPRTFAKLDAAGAGPVLVNWENLADWEKAKYRYNNQGDEPHFWMSDCNKTRWNIKDAQGRDVLHTSAFWDPSLNHTKCVAERLPNGSVCPARGVDLDRAQAGRNCISGFCAADTGICEDGFGPVFEETQGAGRNDENQGETSSNDIGGIGLTQKNYTYTKVAPATDPTVTDRRTYGIGTGASYTVDVFGLLQYDALDVNVALTTQKEERTGTYDQSVEVFGLDVPIPPPDRPASLEYSKRRPLAGCKAAVWSDGEWQDPDCSVTTDNDALPEVGNINPVEVAIPLPIGECEEWGKDSLAVATSGVKQKGKLCFKETTVVGFVPITVKAEVTINALLRFGAIVDPADVSPAFMLAPGIGMGLDVRGGVGIQEAITVYAGVRSDITIVELTFPISWSLKAEALSDANQHQIDGLYAVKYRRNVDLQLRFLKMALGIFVELGIGPFSHEWNWDLLGFGGTKLTWPLKSDALQTTKVDFEWEP